MRATMWTLAVLAALFSGCAFLKSIGRTAAVAGGAGAGAVVGSAAGPVGTFAGGAAGGGLVYAMQENSELRTGSLQGDEARDAELDRLKSMVILMRGEMSMKEIAVGEAERRFEEARRYLAETNQYWSETKKWWVRLLVLGLITRNLHNIGPFVRALLARRWLLALHWFAHMLFLPWRPKE